MTREQFLSYVWEECKNNDVRFYLSPGKSVRTSGGCCAGWFGPEDDDDQRYVLAVATGSPASAWFEVLVHEFCHMQQWLEGTEIWKKSEKADDFWDWVDKDIEISPSEAKKQALLLIDVELDCERRVVRMVKKLKLPVDVPSYIKQANSYVYFYHLVLKHRRWYKIGREPFRSRNILEEMPNTLNGNHHTLSPRVIKVYEEFLGWH